MIPTFARTSAVLAAAGLSAACGHSSDASAPARSAPIAPTAGASTACLASGDGYLRAKLAGAVEAQIDWPNSGTRCEGESRGSPPGVHLSFRRDNPGKPDLLLVFGLTGIRPGADAHEVGANVTVIVQGTTGFYGTQGDSRCTVDSLVQRPLTSGTYRIEARGFCTQPAHAVRGSGDVLVSTFEFAGPVNFSSTTDGD